MTTQSSPRLASHADSWIEPADLTKVVPPYRKSHDFPGDHVDAFHAQMAQTRKSMFTGPMDGSLRIADALKLYELAYFASGDILELGTFRGLSGWVMANALKNAGARHRIVTIDMSPDMTNAARQNIADQGLSDYITFITAEGAAGIRDLAASRRRFGMAFVDHSHEAAHVESASRALPGVLTAGAPVAFHDFNDFRNLDPAHPDYGVIQGVERARRTVPLEFRGIYGCLAVYQFVPPPMSRLRRAVRRWIGR